MRNLIKDCSYAKFLDNTSVKYKLRMFAFIKRSFVDFFENLKYTI